jgi:hypothetical protein
VESQQFTSSQIIRRVLGTPIVCYLAEMIPTILPILGQMKPVQILPSYFFKIYFTITSPSKPINPLTFKNPASYI